MRSINKIFLMPILTVGGGFGAYVLTEILLARAFDREAISLAERIDAGETISTEEIRITAQSILRRRFSREHHDAAVVLIDHGNDESVPDLIRALRWYPPGSTLCKTDHILEALRKITGQDLGVTAREWRRWGKTTDQSAVERREELL